MNTPVKIGEVDQLNALTRDLLADLGLQLIASTNPEPAWLAELSGEQHFDVMLTNAANITERGRLWALLATRTPAGDIAAHFVEVGRSDDAVVFASEALDGNDDPEEDRS